VIKSLLKKISIKFINILLFPIDLIKYFSLGELDTVIIKKDNYGWALDDLADKTGYILNKLNKKYIFLNIQPKKQFLYLVNQYEILKKNFFIKNKNNIIAIDYLHGIPDYLSENKILLNAMVKNQDMIKIIRVSNKYFQNFLISNGIKESKIFLVPLTVYPNFKVYSINEKYLLRKKYNIQNSNFTIGYFQKDGVGWGEGIHPKLIKGPDIFIKSIEIINKQIPNLQVILSGPSRGYVIKELKKLKINFIYLKYVDIKKMPEIYNLLNLYLITSRDEGGPMALAESMSSGVPVISTKVGMSPDIIINKNNGFLTEINDYKTIASYAYEIYSNERLRNNIINNSIKSAKTLTLDSQINNWKVFFNKYLSD
jgi:glycosyltransferase involved in cell wall biosynthesis